MATKITPLKAIDDQLELAEQSAIGIIIGNDWRAMADVYRLANNGETHSGTTFCRAIAQQFSYRQSAY